MRNGVKFLRFPVSPFLRFTVSPSRRFPRPLPPVPCPFPFTIRHSLFAAASLRFSASPFPRLSVSPSHQSRSPLSCGPAVQLSLTPCPLSHPFLRITLYALRPPPHPSHQPSQPSKQQNCSSRFRCRVNSKPTGIPDVCATKHNRHRGVIWAETE